MLAEFVPIFVRIAMYCASTYGYTLNEGALTKVLSTLLFAATTLWTVRSTLFKKAIKDVALDTPQRLTEEDAKGLLKYRAAVSKLNKGIP